MADLTFADQVWLSVIDKLALGSVLVGIGYLANRRLESQKSRQTLRARMAELRMPKIAAEIERFTAQSASVTHHLQNAWGQAEALVIMHAEYARELQAATTAEDARVRATLLANTPSDQMTAFKNRLVAMQETTLRLLHGTEESWKATRGEQFWLGTELTAVLQRRYSDLFARLASPEIAAEWLRTLPRENQVVVEWPGRIARLRRAYSRWRDERMLRRLGLSTTTVQADIDRMIDHVST